MVLRRILGPSLETGAVFDAALSGNYCRIADSVSVMAVQEKCDEKVWELPPGTAMLGVGSSAGPLLEKREKGRTPIYFAQC